MGWYRNVSNFQQIIETPLPNQQNYIAISKIMKAHYMQYIVDLYGDAPTLKPLKDKQHYTGLHRCCDLQRIN
jgi:hypothetical protein